MLRRAPGTTAIEFGQLLPLTACWASAAAAAAGGGSRSRTSQQHTWRQAPASLPTPAAQMQQQQQQAGAMALVVHSEAAAWACNMPDPAAALDCLQRAALLAKAAGPAGCLVAQPGECFATPLPCGFRCGGEDWQGGGGEEAGSVCEFGDAGS